MTVSNRKVKEPMIRSKAIQKNLSEMKLITILQYLYEGPPGGKLKYENRDFLVI